MESWARLAIVPGAITINASLKAAVSAGKEVTICLTIVFLELVLEGECFRLGVAHWLAFSIQDATGDTAILTALEVAIFDFPFVPDYRVSTFRSKPEQKGNLLTFYKLPPTQNS